MRSPTPLLEAKLASLTTMGAAALRSEWRITFDTPAPPGFNRDLLARAIAHKLQEKAHGGLPLRHARQLETATAAKLSGKSAAQECRPKTGTRLSRVWHGVGHHVIVLDDGYEYENQRYASLSVIARQITGASWSGPRFFGLRTARPIETRDAGR
jgi:hypothetical protein